MPLHTGSGWSGIRSVMTRRSDPDGRRARYPEPAIWVIWRASFGDTTQEGYGRAFWSQIVSMAKFRTSVDPYAGAVSGVVTLAQAEGTIWVAEHTPPGMSLMT